MSDSIIQNYFGISDLISAFAWLIFLASLIYLKSLKIESKRLARLYIFNFFFKITFCIVFILTYLYLYNGGDTTAYWHGAECIQNLMAESPFKAIEHLLTTPERANYHTFFNESTGFPPIWIYREPESYFICKLTSIISLLCFKSYLAASFIFAYLLAIANWKVYMISLNLKLFQEKYLPYAILFISSVSFWCAGVSKDTIILISFFNLFYYIYAICYLNKRSLKEWLLVLFFLFVIYKTRNFMLLPILLPFMVAYLTKYLKQYKISPIIKTPLLILVTGIIIGTGILFLSSDSGSQLIANNSFIQEAIEVQHDFKNNMYYGKNQYSLGEIDNSPLGIMKSIPISIFSGIYQPLPWNGLTLSLFLNAVESLILLFLTFRIIITGRLIIWINTIRKNEILLFLMIFVLIIAFMAGFTSVIYGVLVRIRAPLLPVFALLLFTKVKKKAKPNNEIIEPLDQPITNHSLR